MFRKLVLALLVLVLIVGAFAFIAHQFNAKAVAERPAAAYNMIHLDLFQDEDDNGHGNSAHPRVGWNS